MVQRRRVLVLFAHPAVQSSQINHAMLAALRSPPEVGEHSIEIHDLYEAYPHFFIDVQAEQERLMRADLIIFQCPLFWYSTPALMKQWQDEVLELGWAYGEGGTHLVAKDFMIAMTTGGGVQTYSSDGQNRFTMTEFLRPLEATVLLCGMRWLPPFIYHGAFHANNADIAAHAQRYRALIQDYVMSGGDALAAYATPDLESSHLVSEP